eukprot:TRINITY_DN71691_c1_g1_i1.p1 TRINITY_DN71691_c1_g1~~TRINITY_DN71691_c1_g1_i1.p1  ORF type:complete len:286 (-),score=8.96 TRINITY_DN71691_c1_g1_i1:95-952(-)
MIIAVNLIDISFQQQYINCKQSSQHDMSTGNRYPKWSRPPYADYSSSQYKRETWGSGTSNLHSDSKKYTKKFRPTYHSTTYPAEFAEGSSFASSTYTPKPYAHPNNDYKTFEHYSYVILIRSNAQGRADVNQGHYGKPPMHFVKKTNKPAEGLGAGPSNERTFPANISKDESKGHFDELTAKMGNLTTVPKHKEPLAAENAPPTLKILLNTQYGPKTVFGFKDTPKEITAKICTEGKIEDLALEKAIEYYVTKSLSNATQAPFYNTPQQYYPSMPPASTFYPPPY